MFPACRFQMWQTRFHRQAHAVSCVFALASVSTAVSTERKLAERDRRIAEASFPRARSRSFTHPRFSCTLTSHVNAHGTMMHCCDFSSRPQTDCKRSEIETLLCRNPAGFFCNTAKATAVLLYLFIWSWSLLLYIFRLLYNGIMTRIINIWSSYIVHSDRCIECLQILGNWWFLVLVC